MQKTRVKLMLWLAILAILGGLGWLALFGVAALEAYFEQSADPAPALNITPNTPPDLHVKLTWLPDDGDPGRQLEPFTRTEIEGVYLRAWLQLNLSYLRGEPYGLKSYFGGPALEAVNAAVAGVAAQGWRMAQADTTHALKLHFYSADGSIVSFTDTETIIGQAIRDQRGMEVFAGETVASYDVVMFLEDGNWRVRHWVRIGDDTFDNQRRSRQPRPDFVAGTATGLTLNGAAYGIAGINYYPQATPWHEFWPNYDPAVIEQDFARMQQLGLNTVRVFVPFEQWGGPRINTTYQEQLADLLTRADQHGLKVIVTLFDFRVDYQPLAWPSADRQLEALLTRFRDNPAILAWDLKNEPDLDYAAHGRETVTAWLAHTARLARTYDPNHLLTVGWSSPEAAPTLAEHLDFVSFHFYAPAAQLPARYTALRAAVSDRPIVLTEFGLPTWNSFFFPNGHSEPEQAMYYADVLSAMRATDSSGYLAWTLYDFGDIPANVAGSWPWQRQPQKYLGVLRGDGEPKRAAALLTPNAKLEVTRIPAWARFFKPFWFTVFSVVLLSAYITNRMRQGRFRFPLRRTAAE
jgi:hypothetical protein